MFSYCECTICEDRACCVHDLKEWVMYVNHMGLVIMSAISIVQFITMGLGNKAK